MNPVDKILQLMKWPVGLLALAFLPASLVHLQRQLWPLIDETVWGFCGIVAGVLFVIAGLLKFPPVRFAFTFQHEFSHVLFAWLTGHWVSNFTVRWRANARGESGSVLIHGGTNWLILIAPYFVPILPVLLLLPVIMYLEDYRAGATVATLCFGAVLHFALNWQQSHKGQSDLRKVGLLFSLIFLPTANLVVYGLIIATTLRGSYGAERYFETLYLMWHIHFDTVMGFISSGIAG